MKKLLALSLSLVLAMGILSGCGQKEEPKADSHQEEQQTQEINSLEPWQGTWNSMAVYLDSPGLEEAFTKLGQKDGKTAEEARAAYKLRRATDFGAAKIEGDKVTFYADKQESDTSANGEVKGEAEYKFVEHRQVEAKDWYIFEATGDSPHKYLLLMPMHGEGDFIHFHFRYADSIDAAFGEDMKSYYPALVKTNTTDEQLAGEIAE